MANLMNGEGQRVLGISTEIVAINSHIHTVAISYSNYLSVPEYLYDTIIEDYVRDCCKRHPPTTCTCTNNYWPEGVANQVAGWKLEIILLH